MTSKRILYVGGIDERVDKNLLHAAFIPFGDILDIKIPMNYKDNVNRGFAFIEFEDPIDAKAAMDNMHMSELYGKILTVNFAKPGALQNVESTTKEILTSKEVDEIQQRIAEYEQEVHKEEEKFQEPSAKKQKTE